MLGIGFRVLRFLEIGVALNELLFCEQNDMLGRILRKVSFVFIQQREHREPIGDYILLDIWVPYFRTHPFLNITHSQASSDVADIGHAWGTSVKKNLNALRGSVTA